MPIQLVNVTINFTRGLDTKVLICIYIWKNIYAEASIPYKDGFTWSIMWNKYPCSFENSLT
jgi:hypothetical protein